MRITDPGLDANDHGQGPPRIAGIMDQIKGTSDAPKMDRATGTPVWEQSSPGGEVQSNKLKSMLAGLKSKAE
jgi:hypothetical protein